MKSEWDEVGGLLGGSRMSQINGRECYVTLEPRPAYCDRGNYIAKVFARGSLVMELDGADGWPRYYFDFDRAKAEIEDWLKKRGQWIDP